MRLPPRTRRRLAVSFALLGLWFVAGGLEAAPPNDPGWAQQWAPARIGAATAWDTSRASGILIGVVDTGVDLTHEDLAAKVVAATTCEATDGDPAACAGDGQDDEGHGTHVAGIAAAITGNGKGVAGVAPDAKLLVAKALFHQTSGPARGTIGDLNAGIRWVVDRGAHVVNLSLGGNLLLASTPGTTLRDGIDYAWSKGAVVVLAAGNAQALGFGAADYGSTPAIVVAATGPDDEVSSDSSPTGTAQWAIAAPGGNPSNTNPNYSETDREILSAFPGSEYALMHGTSMAAPHVAGAIALVRARPGITAQQSIDIVLDAANSSVSCGDNSPNCAGRLDAAAAVAAAGPAGPTTTTTTASTTTTSALRTTTTTTAAAEGSTTTAPLESTTTTAGEISVPQPTERPTTTTDDPGESASGGGDGGGDGGGGVGPLAAFGALALLGAGGWAAVVARRNGFADLMVIDSASSPVGDAADPAPASAADPARGDGPGRP